ncbi:MAG: NAD(P)-binding domain-containing protein [Paracoccaceae bacterium]
MDDLVSRGAVEAACLEDLARGCSVILMCLTGSPEVAAAVATMKPGLARGAVIVDCSTTDPTFALAMANGGDDIEDYVPHLSDFIARADGL